MEFSEKELEMAFDKILTEGPELYGTTSGYVDRSGAIATSLLAKAILKLNRTSGRLAMVNTWLTVALLLIGVLQIVLMLRGH